MRTLTVVLGLWLAATALPGGSQASYTQLSRAGWDALNGGRVAEAARAFNAALEVAPRQPTLLLGAGIAARLQGHEDEARRLFIDALRFDPI